MKRALNQSSAAELIALASGRRGLAAYADAHRLVEKLGLKKLADAGEAEIREVCSRMTPDAVQRLLAGVEIGLRIAELQTEYCEESRITSPATAIRFCQQRFGRLARESKQEECRIHEVHCASNDHEDRQQVFRCGPCLSHVWSSVGNFNLRAELF